MRNPASYRRAAAAICLVLAGVLSGTFVLLAAAPGWDSDQVERLQAVADAGTSSTVSFLAFVAYQLPWMVGLVGVARLVRGRAPVLAHLAAALVTAGAFGYAVYGGAQLMIPAMTTADADLEVFAQLRTDAEPLTGPFAAVGMAGAVLGLLLLSIALWRTRVGPRWIPVMLWGFLAVEFIGTSISPTVAPFASTALLLAGLTSLAVVVWRSPVAAWTSADERSHLLEWDLPGVPAATGTGR
jgi:hypothetical protein